MKGATFDNVEHALPPYHAHGYINEILGIRSHAYQYGFQGRTLVDTHALNERRMVAPGCLQVGSSSASLSQRIPGWYVIATTVSVSTAIIACLRSAVERPFVYCPHINILWEVVVPIHPLIGATPLLPASGTRIEFGSDLLLIRATVRGVIGQPS